MITNTNNRTLLSVSGTEYDFTFRIDEESELEVYGIDSDGESTLLTTGFSISFSAEDEEGTVTFSLEPSTYEQILMLRAKDYKQNTDIPIRAGFSEEDLENALDHIVMLIQQIKEITDYCIKADLTSPAPDFELPVAEAGKAIIWNSTEDGLENSAVDLTALSDAVDDLNTAVAAAAASASAASGSASAASASASAAAASAASINMPSMVGNALKLLRANAGETALEYLSPAAMDVVVAMASKIFKAAKGADVASVAGAITLGEDGNCFDITGTNAITSITAKQAGTVVQLQFDSTASLVDGSNLKLNGNFTGAAEATITLMSDGTNWFELSRSPDNTSAKRQVFTSSGTFVAPAGVTRVYLSMVGVGGPSGTGSGSANGGGGGAGNSLKSFPYTVVPGNSYTVTIGTTASSTTSFDTVVSVTGGAAGGNASGSTGGAAGVGAAATTGAATTNDATVFTVRVAGGNGSAALNSDSSQAAAGNGGASALGRGGNAQGPIAPGPGGGAYGSTNGTPNTGGTGMVIVEY